MAVAYGLSFAALIFAPPLTPWIAYGIAATFLTSAVAAAIVSARASQARSATIRTELDSVVYALSFEAYGGLRRENRAVNQALLTYVVKVMAERLNFASKTTGVLRR